MEIELAGSADLIRLLTFVAEQVRTDGEAGSVLLERALKDLEAGPSVLDEVAAGLAQHLVLVVSRAQPERFDACEAWLESIERFDLTRRTGGSLEPARWSWAPGVVSALRETVEDRISRLDTATLWYEFGELAGPA